MKALGAWRVIDWLHEDERMRLDDHSVPPRPVVTDLRHLRRDLLRQARTRPAEFGRPWIVKLQEPFAFNVEHARERCGRLPGQGSRAPGWASSMAPPELPESTVDEQADAREGTNV